MFSARLLLVFCCIGLQVKSQHLYMKQFTSSDGLPGSTVNDIIQDDDGFLWFATDNGVSRFDGHQFINYNKSDGIADDEVIRLGKDQQHRIWFLGFNGKASFYCNGTFYNEKNSAVAAQTILGSSFTKFLISKSGTVYLVSLTDGYLSIDGDHVKRFSKEILQRKGVPYFNGFKYVKMDTAGRLWIFSKDSVYLLRKQDINATSYPLNRWPEGFNQSFFLSDGSYIIPTDNKLVRYEGSKVDSVGGLLINPLFDYVSIEEDGNNNLWMMSKTGAYLFKNKILEEAHKIKVLDGKYGGHVYSDSEGNTWLAPLRDGVYMIPALDVQFFNTESGLMNNNVLVLAPHPQGMLAGFANGSVQLIKYKNHSMTLQPPVAIGSYMVDILPLSPSRYLYLTNSEVVTGDDHMNIIDKTVANWAKSYCLRKDGSLLVGGGFLLSALKDGKLSLLYKFDHENRIYAITEDHNHSIWLATEEGLYSFDGSTMSFFGDKFPDLKGRICDVKLDSSGRFWIASSQNGLLLFDNNRCRSVLPTEGKISARKIFMDKDGTIYLATDKGIFIIREDTHEHFNVSHIRKSDGIASDKINTLFVRDGMLWIGTDEGLQVFPLDKKLHEGLSIPIRLTAFNINGRTTPAESVIDLNYDQNNIHLSFTGISFREPHSVLYRYKLHSSLPWQYTSNSTLDLPDLSPGNYELTVQAGTLAGNWSSVPLHLKFCINPPFWKTWWFYASAFIVFGLGGFFAFKYRYMQQVKKEEQKRKSAEAELVALRSQMNPHFIFNSLNAIQDFIFQHQTEEANEYLSKFAKLIRAILNQSRKKFVTIEEECELLKMYLELESLRFDHSFDWEMRIGKEISPGEMLIPSMLLQPLVENSIKHGFKNLKRKGILKVGFRREKGFIRCEVEDNGGGRSFDKLKDGHSLALSITHERMVMLNQSLNKPCKMEVIDLFNNGEKAGLKTVFLFPLDIFFD